MGFEKDNKILEKDDIWRKLITNNSHIPKQVFEILENKGYELFEGDICISEKKPTLVYIPNINAKETISDTLKNNQKLLFLVLGGYESLFGNSIKGSLTSVAYIYDKATGKTYQKIKKFKANYNFDIKLKGTGALLIRKNKKF